jgi:hypothetical protein
MAGRKLKMLLFQFCTITLATIFPTDEWTPKSFEEAKDHPEWLSVSIDEVDKLFQKECMGDMLIKDVPKGKQLLGSRFVYKVKRSSAKKARWVAKGYMEAVDGYSTYAPASILCVVRIILIIATTQGLQCEAIDFVSAFINADLKVPVYMHYPKGYGKEGHCVIVWKAVYGLKISGRLWNHLLVSVLEDYGFKQSKAFTSMFYHPEKKFWINTHVDDLYCCASTEDLSDLRNHIEEKWKLEITYETNPTDYLGIDICHHPNGDISISQPNYIAKMLNKFNMEDATETNTPMTADPLVPAKEEEHGIPYRQLIGSLIYFSLCIGPVISFVVKELSRFLHQPSAAHWKAAKRVLRFLKRGRFLRITYTNGNHACLDGLVDSDWAGQLPTRKSTSGYIIYFHNQPVAWRSWTHKRIACSTAEAELVGLGDMLKEMTWLRNGLIEIGVHDDSTPAEVYIDNQASKRIFEDQNFRRVRHMELMYQFNATEVAAFNCNMNYIETAENVADIFTKGLSAPTLLRHMSKIYSNVEELFGYTTS